MNPSDDAQLLVIPCSGIGKVHGLMSREAVYQVADRRLPERADTVCLALLVTGDPETREKVRHTPCITVDGCHKLCAFKNVELSGGKIVHGIRAYDVMKRHRGADFGTAASLSEEGWAVVEELAAEVCDAGVSPAKAAGIPPAGETANERSRNVHHN